MTPENPETDWWATARMIVNGAPAGTPLPTVAHQPREHSVPCQGCRTPTWDRSAICADCQLAAELHHTS